jgi:hypothetical protein
MDWATFWAIFSQIHLVTLACTYIHTFLWLLENLNHRFFRFGPFKDLWKNCMSGVDFINAQFCPKDFRRFFIPQRVMDKFQPKNENKIIPTMNTILYFTYIDK